jgi:hypothetical protein
VFGSGNFAGSGIEDSAFIQELEAAYTAAVSREGDSKLAEALLNKEQVCVLGCCDCGLCMHRGVSTAAVSQERVRGQRRELSKLFMLSRNLCFDTRAEHERQQTSRVKIGTANATATTHTAASLSATAHHPQAALAARAYRMTREAALLRAQLAMARNQPTVWPTEGPEQL